ncbi:NAD-dependent epimerase/dehydratase family protein [Lentibacillus saliphilus]|uniref:NAD-dependent epimerase/dehydratase family protein n=1 Tax=Lentibacillus saliphilus TaxID=2737028 RepID=UPI001C2FC2E2|nr:NAD-dependent epimerase/dehydratase family protein [Lentibacillus saliphilus]
MKKRVFILGGTGLLGYHTTKELLKRGYEVSTVSLPPMPTEDLLPKEVTCHLGDINEMTDEQILEMLKGVDMFIHAAGADERTVPEAPAARFFYEQNVIPTQRLARLARQSGVKRFVIYGSYFAHFAEQWPDLKMATEQAYPRTRLLQEEVAMLEGEGEMDVMSLRLPYIFGTMPGRKPLWEMFLPYIQGKDVVHVLNGGTAMVTAQQVAEATLGALEFGAHGGKYAISDTNMKHKDFYQLIANVLGQTETVIQVVPLDHMKPAYVKADEKLAASGREQGMHNAIVAEVQNRDAYVDPNDTMPILKYNKADIEEEIIKTIKACLD